MRIHAKVNDFTKGSIPKNIMNLAIPMTLAQIINVLYNIVDRLYIGRLPGIASDALAGLGITFPIIMIVIAFANLVGMGGAPLFSIQRGKQNTEKAQRIMGNSFHMLILFGIGLTLLFLVVKKPLLYLFGASNAIFPYANDYITIYLLGSVFVMISLGMNTFINAQGFGKVGMLSVFIGAILNLLLDPLFIFVFGMGVRGAAVATVLSQGISALWVLYFLCQEDSTIKLRWSFMKLDLTIVREIISLGMSGFVMSITNSLVQIVCNASLQRFGRDAYISIMTIINSMRDVISMPASGITNAAQPIIGYNYGANAYQRVKTGIRFMTFVCVLYMFLIWLFVIMNPAFFIHIFSNDHHLLDIGIPAIQMYYFGYVMMALQFSGQSTFVALNRSKEAVFFSLFRKVIIVVPLTLWLPHFAALGVMGVFLAEPISNFIGGTACYITMLSTVYKKLKKRMKACL